MSTVGFFEERSTASRVKHMLLLRYLPVFAMKTSVGMTARRAYYLDGYAGPGMYDDASPGSPLIAADVAAFLGRTSSQVRSTAHCELVGIFIEEDPTSAAQLRTNLAAAGRGDWDVMQGQSVDRLSDAIQLARGAPLLVFLDPYGLGIPFDMLVEDILRRAERDTTEVLLNFSRSALSRLGGFLDPDWDTIDRSDEQLQRLYQQRDLLLARLDAFLGGPWWRGVKRHHPTDWRDAVRDRFVGLINDRTDGGWRSYRAAVPQRWQGPPVYDLVLLSRHAHGPWKLNEATARTFRDLYEAAWTQAGTLFAAQTDAIPDPRPVYVAAIERNVLAELRANQSFGVADRLDRVLSDEIRGLAGPSEVLRALQGLHRTGRIGGDPPKSKALEDYIVTRGPRFG